MWTLFYKGKKKIRTTKHLRQMDQMTALAKLGASLSLNISWGAGGSLLHLQESA